MRPTHVTAPEPVVTRGADGVVRIRDARPLGEHAAHLTERLDLWAARAPDRPYLVARDERGDWQALSYAEAHARVRSLAQALLDRGLSPERPLVILSGNGVEHALLALAAMYVGVVYAPVSPAYSLQTRDFAALAGVFVFLQDQQPAAFAVHRSPGVGVERAQGAARVVVARCVQPSEQLLAHQAHGVDA